VTIALVVGSFVLAAVFAGAGLAKLADLEGTREASRAFGAPERLAGEVAVALPLTELVIALALLPSATRWWAAVAALVLVLVFCGAIARVMARGDAPACHCFGQLHSAPAGWATLARNGLLVGVATGVVVAGRDGAGPGAFAWMTRVDAVDWLVLTLTAAVGVSLAVGGYAVVHVMRSYGRVLVRLDMLETRLRAAGFDLDEPQDVPQLGLAPGTTAPEFWLPSIDGDRVGLSDLIRPGKPALLLFTSPRCGPCSVLMPTVAGWQRDHADKLTVALLSGGDAEEVRAEAARHGLANVLFDEGLTAYEAYEANGTPSAVLVADDGTVASWLAAGSEWIEMLVEQTVERDERVTGLPLGSPLPDVRLEQLGGPERSLADLAERDSVVLFWNPGCGFCRAMHKDIRAWEASPPPGAPDLIVVASGSAADVRAEGFASRVLLDREWALSTALGADGTPMAVLVTADGRVASALVTGRTGVLGLLAAREPALTNL
jgi:thiol-disulfide isomerase/thioredoxin